jgi:hypothetical protein
MLHQYGRVAGCLTLAFTVGLGLLLLLGAAAPRLAEAQIIQSFTLREFGLFTRDGAWDLYIYPGNPFGFGGAGARFNVNQVCAPSGGGGVFLSGGDGMGDLAMYTPGWPFPASSPLCDPDADDTLWFAYGSSLNALAPGFVPPRFTGRNFPLQPPSCSTVQEPVEGLFLVGRRSADRQGPDLSCQNRDPNFPIRTGNVLICSLAAPWVGPGAAPSIDFASCEFYATCSDRVLGPIVPRGSCAAAGIGTGATGTVVVTVNDARDGTLIPGAVVTRTRGGGSQVTDTNGQATFTGVLAGAPVEFSAGATGFVTATATTVPVANGTTGLTISLTPPPPPGQLRVVLNWGADPRDLDSHLTGPAVSGRFHVAYFARDAAEANLDTDDTSGFGPETITVTTFRPGVYRYSVHHFAGNGSICSTAGQISVNVFFGSSQVATFRPPSSGCIGGVNDVWVVFEFNPSIPSAGLVVQNTFYSSSSSGVVGTEVEGYDDDAALLRTLPAK